MTTKWKAPPPAPTDLPICAHPGCRERAEYGYGSTLRTEGRSYCHSHRPDGGEIPFRGPVKREARDAS